MPPDPDPRTPVAEHRASNHLREIADRVEIAGSAADAEALRVYANSMESLANFTRYYRDEMQAIRDHAYIARFHARTACPPDEQTVKIVPAEVTAAFNRFVRFLHGASLRIVDGAEGQCAVDRRTVRQILDARPDWDEMRDEHRSILIAWADNHKSEDHGWTMCEPIGATKP